jgi:phytoene dehydrogenase-like protein
MLARRGRKVVVLERRQRIGGLAASEEFHPGYRTAGVLHDTSAVRRWVIDQLELRKHGLELLRELPPIFVPQNDGTGYLHWRDPGKAASEIGPRSRRDAEAYRRFRSFIERIRPVVRKVFDDVPPDAQSARLTDLWGLGKKAISLRLLGRSDMMELARIAPMCVADWVSEYFETEIVRAAVAAPATLNGLTGPWSPGTGFNLLLSESLAQVAVRGGPAALIAALESAARATGAEIRTDARVTRLDVQQGAVAGVTLANGEVLEADRVAAACDPKHLFLDLVPPHLLSLEFERNISLFRARGTAAKIDLALSGYPEITGRPELQPAFLRTGAGLDELERAFDPVKYREFALEPVLDFYVPTIERPELAPAGHHVFSIQVHWVPYDLEGGWTDEARERLLESALDALAAYMPTIRQALVAAAVASPVDLERTYGVTGGHLYHGEHAIDQLVLRPTPECARYATPFEGLYLCGSGSHPGGGISCAPGALASRTLLD